jgi:hypothetical protein
MFVTAVVTLLVLLKTASAWIAPLTAASAGLISRLQLRAALLESIFEEEEELKTIAEK